MKIKSRAVNFYFCFGVIALSIYALYIYCGKKKMTF